MPIVAGVISNSILYDNISTRSFDGAISGSVVIVAITALRPLILFLLTPMKTKRLRLISMWGVNNYLYAFFSYEITAVQISREGFGQELKTQG
jgi:hypothetical protein